MQVSTRQVDGVTVLDVAGEILGGAESDPLRRELERSFEHGERQLLVNLSDVSWMNSAGLGIFLAAYSRLRAAKGEVRFFGVGPRVRQILHTTKLLSVLVVLDDEKAGIRSFREPGRIRGHRESGTG